MSSSVASIGEHTAQQNFNPSWMRSAFHGGGGGGVGSTPRASANDEAQDDYPLSDPVLSDYRYTREDLLAIAPKDSNPPGELAECPFFVEIAQPPIVANPLNDLEQRLQHNINSSKAMSSLSHAERASIAAGGVYGGGYSSAANGQSPNSPATRTPVGGGWTTQRQTSWTKTNTPERAQRGGANVRGGSGGFYSRGGGRTENGGGITNGNASSTLDESYSKFAALRRGGGPGAVGRGGSTTAYNSRAEKLYSKDERPRGVGVSRSGSDEENDDGGWETVGAKNVQNGEKQRPAWTRSESWTNRNNENSNTGGAWNRNEKNNGARDNSNVWRDRQQMLDSLQDAPDDNDVNTANPLTEPTSTTTESSNSLQQTISDSTATTSESYASQVQDAVAAAAQQQQQFSSAWPSSVMSGLPNMFDMERLRLAQMQQQQQIAAQLAAQQQAAAVAQAQAAAVAVKKEPVDFYYLDPSETVRGPFSKDQMVAWFKAGYFSEESLRVKRETDSSYLTIGQLLQQNGKMTPFDYPDEQEPVRTSPTQALSQFNLTQQLNNSNAYGNFRPSNMWGTGPLDALVQSTLEKQLAAERQRIVDEYTRRAQEEADNFKKMQEAFMRQVNMHHEMTNQQYREQELVLQRQAEELQRREAEMKEHALELQKKLEEQHNQLNEKQRAINEEASRKAAEEQARKEREAQLAKKLAEEEERRKKAEQAAEMEKQRLAREAEVAAERIRQLNIQKKVESDAAARKKREEEDRRLAEELSRKQFEIEQSFEKATKPKQISPSGSDDSEGGWTSVAKPHTKPAPWAAAKQPEPVKEKTLREIQMEEERQAKVEAERLANLRKEEQREQQSLQSAATWGNTSARLQWAGSVNGSASPPAKPKSAGPVWTTPQEPSRSSYVSPMFDGPSLEAANRIQPAKKVQAVAAKPAAPAAAAPKKATVAPTPKPPVEQKSKEQQASDQMCTWFSKRFKQLSNNADEIDTSMLFQFVMDLGNPNEVEDIVMSYLDESKSVKEFVREFLKRRIELRANNNKQSDHDDLSSARAVSAAPSDSNAGSMGGSGGSGVQGKKKKKNQRMVLDGNILGFRGAAASDRLNKGEIDAIPTAPVNPSRR